MLHIKRFEFNSISVNTYIIFDETKKAAVIDCGVSNENEKKELTSYISDNELNISQSLTTHVHFDHTLGLSFLCEKYRLKAQYHPLEEELAQRLPYQAKLFGFRMNFLKFGDIKHIDDNELIQVGESIFRTIWVPGHSPGSLCFYSERDACLFSGDVLFRDCIGRSDLWGGNHDLLVKGIKDKLFVLPEETAVYPGHGPVTTIRYEKRHNQFI